jgi:hypothetical protein
VQSHRLSRNRTYYFRIAATTAFGESVFSNVAFGTTHPKSVKLRLSFIGGVDFQVIEEKVGGKAGNFLIDLVERHVLFSAIF